MKLLLGSALSICLLALCPLSALAQQPITRHSDETCDYFGNNSFNRYYLVEDGWCYQIFSNYGEGENSNILWHNASSSYIAPNGDYVSAVKLMHSGRIQMYLFSVTKTNGDEFAMFMDENMNVVRVDGPSVDISRYSELLEEATERMLEMPLPFNP